MKKTTIVVLIFSLIGINAFAQYNCLSVQSRKSFRAKDCSESQLQEDLRNTLKNRDFNAALSLVTRDIDIDVNFSMLIGPYDNDASTPLYIAVSNGKFDLAKKLLEKGANPNISTTTYQATPLMRVAGNNSDESLELARLLIQSGADVNAQCSSQNNGNTALISAAITNDIKLAELLLENGADPSIKTSSGKDFLESAEQFKNFDFVQHFAK